MNPDFIKKMKHPVLSRMFLFFKLPSAFFAGVRIREVNEKKCVVTVPYKWFSQNPFRSTYFACLAMAGEMSSGSLAMAHVYQRQPPVSMLVVKLEAIYHKKATGVTTFICEEGDAIKQAIEHAVNTGEAQTLICRSEGRNASGDLVATFLLTWSFRKK